jgi:hypothetical protein
MTQVVHASVLPGEGLIPLDAMKTATFMIHVIILAGLQCLLLPGTFLSMYGLKQSPLNNVLCKMYGAGMLCVIFMAYCLLIKDTTLATAYGLSELPWVIETLPHVLTGDAKTVGFTNAGQVFVLVESALVMYATTQDYAETAMKVVTVFWLLNGLYLGADPKGASKLWGAFHTFDATSKFMTRMIGFNMLAHNAFAGSMLFMNVDKLTAFGIGYAFWLIKLVVLQLVTSDAADVYFDKRLMYFWMAVHATVVATILL